MPVHIVAKRDASDDLSAGGNGQMRQMDGGVFCFFATARQFETGSTGTVMQAQLLFSA
jgi:hypothetical protein